MTIGRRMREGGKYNVLYTRNLGHHMTLFLAPAEGWLPSATKWGPFGPPGGPSGPLDKNKYNNSANTNTNTYIAQIEIQLWSKNKYNNRGQIRYGVVRNIIIRVRLIWKYLHYATTITNLGI